MNRFVPLGNIAQVSLGYKSLQNDFFYLNEAVIDTYGIEREYFKPITVFKEIDGKTFLQNPSDATWVFLCRKKESDLRGTGALRYIHAMAERPAAKKKQNQPGSSKTIREVLEAQGGGLWYAPKATPHPTNLWLRKAFDTIYAPFIFKRPRVVDQRCNYVEPLENVDISWELLGAALTSTIFCYALEINGSVGMGAGALEAPTTKLRDYPVFDVASLPAMERKQLIDLATSVWSDEKPIDWSADGTIPGKHLQALDNFLLTRSGAKLTLKEIYSDLRATCVARIIVAQDKVRVTKKQKTDNVTSVAKGIADYFERQLNSRQFPEHFFKPGTESLPVVIDRKSLRQIKIHSFFEKSEVTFISEGGEVIMEGSYDSVVAEVIVRAALLGRENFTAPLKQKDAQSVMSDFFAWFDRLQSRLNAELNESAVGTGYEESVRFKVYEILKIHPLAGERVLPANIHLNW